MGSYRQITKIALCLAVLVIMLGAYTRLTDAGLGCPDWPGCYGKIVLPSNQLELHKAQQIFPQAPIVAHKAWTEMAHRYIAGTLGLIIVILSTWGMIRRRHNPKQPMAVLILLIGVLIFQAALGMWTVTLKLLPVVVTAHLLGGMAIVGLLCWLLQATKLALPPTEPELRLRPWIVAGVFIVIIQIFLGAWTSTNYAALACTGFPACNGFFPIHLEWRAAFDLISPIGPNYEGGRLAAEARVTIQMIHRYWAFITLFYLLPLSIVLRRKGWWIGSLLLVQIGLGIVNVIKMLPLTIAVMHNGMAVLLLITLLGTLQPLYQRGSRLGGVQCHQ